MKRGIGQEGDTLAGSITRNRQEGNRSWNESGCLKPSRVPDPRSWEAAVMATLQRENPYPGRCVVCTDG